MMNVRLAALLLALTLQPLAAAAQPRIGVLNFTQMTDNVKREMLLALREEGYVEGKNIRVEWRGADGSSERRPRAGREVADGRDPDAAEDGLGHRSHAPQAAHRERLCDLRRCRVAFRPTLNEWNGRRSVEMQVLDFQYPEQR